MKSITSPNHLYPKSLDSHCHLFHLRQKGLNILEVLQQWRAEGLEALMDIVLEAAEQDWQWHLQIARSCREDPERYPQVLLSVGVHPHDAELGRGMPDLEERIKSPEVQAIGETGLDYQNQTEAHSLQKNSLLAHIRLAQKYRKVLVIHNRESDADILEILRAHALPAGGIMHCFNGSSAIIEPLLECGFYFSFAGNLTYKNAPELREAASQIPPQRLLVETDAPFLAPQPVRGQINHPGFIGHSIEVLAQCQNLGTEQMLAQLQENWQRLFQGSIL